MNNKEEEYINILNIIMYWLFILELNQKIELCNFVTTVRFLETKRDVHWYIGKWDGVVVLNIPNTNKTIIWNIDKLTTQYTIRSYLATSKVNAYLLTSDKLFSIITSKYPEIAEEVYNYINNNIDTPLANNRLNKFAFTDSIKKYYPNLYELKTKSNTYFMLNKFK